MSKTNLKTATLDELEEQCISVMGTTYGHNMIGIICQEAEDRFGEKEAERLFNTYQI